MPTNYTIKPSSSTRESASHARGTICSLMFEFPNLSLSLSLSTGWINTTRPIRRLSLVLCRLTRVHALLHVLADLNRALPTPPFGGWVIAKKFPPPTQAQIAFNAAAVRARQFPEVVWTKLKLEKCTVCGSSRLCACVSLRSRVDFSSAVDGILQNPTPPYRFYWVLTVCVWAPESSFIYQICFIKLSYLTVCAACHEICRTAFWFWSSHLSAVEICSLLRANLIYEFIY